MAAGDFNNDTCPDVAVTNYILDNILIYFGYCNGTMSSPVFTYLKRNVLKFDEVAFFCTCGSSGADSTLENMEKLIRKQAVSTLGLTKKEIKNGPSGQINNFISEIRYQLT